MTKEKMKKKCIFVLGVAICMIVATFSVMLEKLIPGDILGASIIALFTGTIINSFFHPAWIKPSLKFTSKRILKTAIILLGASLSVNTIMSTGKMTFFVMIFTFAMCFGGGYFIRKVFGLNWKLSNLISAGTGICGGSAVAAIAPVIDADDKDIAFALSSTFLFDMIMVALYPIMGKALGMSNIAYGIWAGTSVNDTASVVASGYAFSEAAGDFATMVKLTRTLSIIPTVITFAFIQLRLKKKEASSGRMTLLFYTSMCLPRKAAMDWASLYSTSPLPSCSAGAAKRTQPSTSPSARMGATVSRKYLLSPSPSRGRGAMPDLY
mgnify:CR=1 FL=1